MTSGSSELGAAQREGLTVIGEGRINTVPDEILLVISADCGANNAGQALSESATKLVQVVHAVMAQGISQADIKTTWINVYPLYGQGEPTPAQRAGVLNQNQPAPQQLGLGTIPQPGLALTQSPPPQVTGFFASRGLQISLAAANHRTGEIIDAVLAAGGSLSGAFAVRLRDEGPVRRAALQAALKDAVARAELVASTLGQQVDSVITVDELAPTGMFGAANGAGGLIYPSLPGELIFTARLQVTFRMRKSG